MSRERDLLEKAVFIGGVPRSGTTFLARSLNSHPDFVVSADDHVLESWGLYYYRKRVGLVDDLRRTGALGVDVVASLEKSLFAGNSLLRVVPSDKVTSFPKSAPPFRPELPDGDDESAPERCDVPLTSLPPAWKLCLKSPEITYVLDDMAALLPEARFIMVYRPLAEVAESMYRMGEKVRKVRIFHRRWREEKDGRGRLMPPPGVPPDWGEIWHDVSDFQRCVINGASYLKALTENACRLPPGQAFIYNHNTFRENPRLLVEALARFLAVNVAGFRTAEEHVVRHVAGLPSALAEGYLTMAEQLKTATLEEKAAAMEKASL